MDQSQTQQQVQFSQENARSTKRTANNEDKCEKGCAETEKDYGDYSRLAMLMSQDPSSAMFHRFAHLSAESLLHYQAELKELEMQLILFREEDRKAPKGTHRTIYRFHSRYLRKSVLYSEKNKAMGQDKERTRTDDPRQWKTICRIRETLKEYYNALLLHQQITKMQHAQKNQLQSLRKWMDRPSMGNMYLIGDDSEIWNDYPPNDFISMEPIIADETMHTRYTRSLLMLYHRVLGRYIHKPEVEDHLRNSILYRHGPVAKWIRGMKSLVACMLPIASILVLHVVKNMNARLGIIAGFTAIFSLTVCFLTSASIKDVFSATAAFSAVLVVFVGVTE